MNDYQTWWFVFFQWTIDFTTCRKMIKTIYDNLRQFYDIFKQVRNQWKSSRAHYVSINTSENVFPLFYLCSWFVVKFLKTWFVVKYFTAWASCATPSRSIISVLTSSKRKGTLNVLHRLTRGIRWTQSGSTWFDLILMITQPATNGGSAAVSLFPEVCLACVPPRTP